MKKADLEDLIVVALKSLGGEAKIADIAKAIWLENEGALRAAGDLFYTWQYDMRWAGQRLQGKGIIKKNLRSWTLVKAR